MDQVWNGRSPLNESFSPVLDVDADDVDGVAGAAEDEAYLLAVDVGDLPVCAVLLVTTGNTPCR